MHSQGPRLKNGVDLQLQSAFYDQNWGAVVRLAEKRAKMANDPYYEVRDAARRHEIRAMTVASAFRYVNIAADACTDPESVR